VNGRFFVSCGNRPGRIWSSKEPDFVLFGKQHGLLILEVKDWRIDQIEEADSHHFEIWIGGREESKTNPDRQARGYVYEINRSVELS
jgi:hypothetical protein